MRCGDCRWFDADSDHMHTDGDMGLCMFYTAQRTMNAIFGGIEQQPKRHSAFASVEPKWCSAWEPRHE